MMTSSGIVGSQAALSAAGDAALLIMASGSEPSEGGGEGGGLRPPASKVLVADDEPTLLRAATRIFPGTIVRAASDVVTSLNVPGAIAAFDREPDAFLAVLSDMSMPGGSSGIDLYRHVRRTHRHLPFAFWSGGMERALKEELDAIRASDLRVHFFDKPTEVDPVIAWFQSALLASGGG